MTVVGLFIRGWQPLNRRLTALARPWQIEDAEELCRKLSCTPDISVKVVSIVGNTGDGKSFTLNHALFGGRDVFETSDLQDSCTAGAWAALCPERRVIAVDTEGMPPPPRPLPPVLTGHASSLLPY